MVVRQIPRILVDYPILLLNIDKYFGVCCSPCRIFHVLSKAISMQIKGPFSTLHLPSVYMNDIWGFIAFFTEQCNKELSYLTHNTVW